MFMVCYGAALPGLSGAAICLISTLFLNLAEAFGGETPAIHRKRWACINLYIYAACGH